MLIPGCFRALALLAVVHDVDVSAVHAGTVASESINAPQELG